MSRMRRFLEHRVVYTHDDRNSEWDGLGLYVDLKVKHFLYPIAFILVVAMLINLLGG